MAGRALRRLGPISIVLLAICVVLPLGLAYILKAEGLAGIARAIRGEDPEARAQERADLLRIIQALDGRLVLLDQRIRIAASWSMGATETTTGVDVMPRPGAPPAASVSVGPPPMPPPPGRIRQRAARVQLSAPDLGPPLEPLAIPDK